MPNMTAKRDERARTRVIDRLCLAAYVDFRGLTRSELARVSDSNDYRRGLADLDRMHAEGDIERTAEGRYRMTLRTIDEVAYGPNPGMASDFFNLSKPYARELRRQRIAANGADVLMPSTRYPEDGSEPRFPRYNVDPYYGLSEAEVLEEVAMRERTTPDPTPEPTLAVWQPDPTPEPPESFWQREDDALELSGFWA